MIISHDKRFIFIHNYKVAGSSIRKALQGHNHHSFWRSNLNDKMKFILGKYPKVFARDVPGHIRAKELKEKISEEIFNGYFKFGFVRNPWNWQVSLYTYMLKIKTHPQHELIKSMKSFDEYIDWRVNNDLHLQKDFFYENDKCLVDFIGKLENLNEDFSKVCNEIGVSVELPHVNASRSSSEKFTNYYTQRSIDIVEEAFCEDIRLFKYLKPTINI